MEGAQSNVPLNVCNRGWDRYRISLAPYVSEEEQKWATALSTRGVVMAPTTRSDLPWAKLAWWESEWQAAKGIKAMCSRPFLNLGPTSDRADQPALVPTRVLYPFAFRSSQTQRIGATARFVAAMVRQAREFYTAATSAGVTDLSRPVLYFYGALALAKAAVAALFGSDKLEHGHGLDNSLGPSTQHSEAPWPNIIHWRQFGEFVMLYRAARWDVDLYREGRNDTQNRDFVGADQPKFHILECIRWLGYDWGMLPPTGFEKPRTAATLRSDRERCLLLYRQPGDEFMRYTTPLDAPLYQAPLIVVQYMVLYCFSVMARYNGLEWQELLAGTKEPEGYVFRVALESVADDFVAEITRLLPLPQDNDLNKFPWFAKRPTLDAWYRQPVERTGGHPVIVPDMGSMEEWNDGSES